MTSQYHVDLVRFSLDHFRHLLETERLLPSEAVLKEEIPARFARLDSMGIKNLAALTRALSSKKKIERFSQESGLPEAYLIVLSRRARSYVPRPIPLKKMPGTDPDLVEILAAARIRNTKHLFEHAGTRRDRAALSELTNRPEEEILELVKLSDLARARYVGPAFARLLYEAGFDTIACLSRQSPEALRERLVVTNSERQAYRAAIPSVADLTSWLETVRELPQVLEC